MTNLRRVYVVDDQYPVVAGLTRLLTESGYQVIAYDSTGAFLSGVHLDAPSCALLEISMPDSQVRSLVELVRFTSYLASPRLLEAQTANRQCDDSALGVEVNRCLTGNRRNELDRVLSDANTSAANTWEDAAGTWTAFSWAMHADAAVDHAGELSPHDHHAHWTATVPK